MGIRAPSSIPLIPDAVAAFVDPCKAAPFFPGSADAKQHALATEGRGIAGVSVGLYLPDGFTASFVVPVAPSVEYLRIRFLMTGDGTVSVDSTNNGTAKTWSSATTIDAVSALSIYETTTIIGDTFSSPLKVRSSAAWTWAEETVTVTFTSSTITAHAGTIHGMCFEPVWLSGTI